MAEIRENPQENIEQQNAREQAAGEFLDAQRDSNIRKFPTATEREKLSDQVKQITKPEAISPQPTKSEVVSDLADEILKKLEGKTDQEKIKELLSGNYEPAAKNEAMAKVIEQQKRAA